MGNKEPKLNTTKISNSTGIANGDNIKDLTRKIHKQKIIIYLLIFSLIFAAEYVFFFTKHVRTTQTAVEEKYGEIEFVRNAINKYYYKDVDNAELEKIIVEEMIGSLGDVYTFYMDPVEYKRIKGQLQGEMTGLGIKSSRKDELMIDYIFPNSPAEKADLRHGDIIISINNEHVKDYEGNILDLIPKVKGEEVTLVIQRGEETLTKELSVDKITYTVVKSEIIEENIGYIYLQEFNDKSSKEFKNHLEKLVDAGIESLVLDIRDNTGGVLKECVNIIGQLGIESKVWAKSYGGIGDEASLETKPSDLNIPIVLLINEYSASASEVLAYNIKTSGKGLLVGQTTYGKGLGQSVLTNQKTGSGLIITSLEVVMDDGYKTHINGVEPDIAVIEGTGIYPYTKDQKTDYQLQEAINQAKTFKK